MEYLWERLPFFAVKGSRAIFFSCSTIEQDNEKVFNTQNISLGKGSDSLSFNHPENKINVQNRHTGN